MSSPLPLRPPVDHAPRARSVIDLADESSTAVLSALGSETARSILGALDGGPATTSDLAEEVGTSLQNVHYHLEKLREADLVCEVGTWYSSKGREMSVYAPTSERLELRIATEEREPVATPRIDAEGSPARVVTEGD